MDLVERHMATGENLSGKKSNKREGSRGGKGGNIHESELESSDLDSSSDSFVLTQRQMRVIRRDMKRINLLRLQDFFYLVAGPLCPQYSRPSVKRFTGYHDVLLTIWVSQYTGQWPVMHTV